MFSFKAYLTEINSVHQAKIKMDHYKKQSSDHYAKSDIHYNAAERIATNNYGQDKPIKGAEDMQKQHIDMHKKLEKSFLHKAKRSNQAVAAAKKIIGKNHLTEYNNKNQTGHKLLKHREKEIHYTAKASFARGEKRDAEYFGHDPKDIGYHLQMERRFSRKAAQHKRAGDIADKLYDKRRKEEKK